MRYYVTLDPEKSPVTVDVQELPSGALDVRVEGRPVQVDVAPIGKGLSVRVDGRVVDLAVEGSPPDVGVVAGGHRSYVRVESERTRVAEQARKVQQGSGEKVIKSPMPGRVVKVLVAKGDQVSVGQPLLVIEAMKMENEIRARAAGVVADVHVTAGEAVEGNAKLVTFA